MVNQRTSRPPVGGDDRNPLGPRQDLTLTPQKADAGVYGRTADFSKADAARTAISNLDDQSGIEVSADGTMTVGGIAVTSKGLVIAASATADDWKRVGQLLHSMKTTIQFLLGDWIAVGATIYGEDYEAVAATMGYKVKSLYTFKYVAENVPVSIRMAELKFGHHALVAPIKSRTEQKRLLKKAVNEKLSIAELRTVIKGDERPTPPDVVTPADAGLKREIKRHLETQGVAGESELKRFLKTWLKELERSNAGD